MKTTYLTKLHNDMLKYLSIFEGYENKAYKDTKGYWTIGIGHKIEPKDNINIHEPLSNQRIEHLFITDCIECDTYAPKIITNYEAQPYQIKLFINLMYFNMGEHLRSFKKANRHLMNFNYGLARIEYLNSQWQKQVSPFRSEHTTNLLRFQQWKT